MWCIVHREKLPKPASLRTKTVCTCWMAQIDRLVKRLGWASGASSAEGGEAVVADEEIYADDGAEVRRATCGTAGCGCDPAGSTSPLKHFPIVTLASKFHYDSFVETHYTPGRVGVNGFDDLGSGERLWSTDDFPYRSHFCLTLERNIRMRMKGAPGVRGR